MTDYKYEVYKLDQPQLQVGVPNTHKWAVGVIQPYTVKVGAEEKTVTMFVEAFKTKGGALDYIAKKTGNIELTAKEAREFKNAKGMYGFAVARKFKARAAKEARENGKPCSLTYNGEVLYTAQPLKCEVCGGNHPEEAHTPSNV